MKHYSELVIENLKTYPSKNPEIEKECDDIFTFDIETSSAWLNKNDEIVPYQKCLSDEEWKKYEPYALCYIWQFSYNEEVYYGRDLREFRDVLEMFPENTHIIIYVHNLAFEFEFLTNILTFNNVFARNAHKVMKCSPYEFPNVEFRCSYFLTRLSLEAWGNDIGVHKKSGDLDYYKVRTPYTELDETELGYCEQDCIVVYNGIKKYLEKYKHIEKIPLTQTGEVRKVVKEKLVEKYHINHMRKLTPDNADFYKKLKSAYQGGYTHANYTLSGRTIKSNEGCAFDFASSYPAVMCSEKFPCTPFAKADFNIDLIDDYAYLLYVEFKDIESKLCNNYISSSKATNIVKPVIDNGRIIKAESFNMWLTEQDMDIILKTYNIKEYNIIECYESKKQYLPEILVAYILELYENKTKLKGIEEKVDLYTKSKQFINCIYGMCVTDILQDSILFDVENNEWNTELKTIEDINEALREIKESNKKRPFIAYQWGVWVSAYARHNLWECLMSCDEDCIYCDTDSIKLRKRYSFDWYNEKITDKLLKCCRYYHLDERSINPIDTKGIAHPLGVFAEEDEWTEFKTLGAKRYCYRTKKDNKLHITVSGISKQAVVVLKDDIENFNEETVFDKDYFFKLEDDFNNGKIEEYGLTPYEDFKTTCEKNNIKDGTKKTLSYCNMQPVIWNKGQEDEYLSDYKRGINLRNVSYSMSISDEYRNLIEILSIENTLECLNI